VSYVLMTVVWYFICHMRELAVLRVCVDQVQRCGNSVPNLQSEINKDGLLIS
jgi:hypothetical protein